MKQALLYIRSVIHNMFPPALLLFLIVFFLLILIGLYLYKISAHFRYLRLKSVRKPGSWFDFIQRNFTFENDSKNWKDAWLIFPLLFGVDVDESDKPDIVAIKSTIRQANILIYLALIICLLLMIYTSKAYPNGLF